MKVLPINAVYNLSSTGRNVTESHLLMLEKGIDSYVAYSKINKPDVVHLNNLHGNYINLPMLMKYLCGRENYSADKMEKMIYNDLEHILNENYN